MFLTIINIFKKNIISLFILFFSQGLRLDLSDKTKTKLEGFENLIKSFC